MGGVKKLRRGVKQVTKAIRKNEKGLVVLAADVSPCDVISHLPVHCEAHGIPYIYIRSRLLLGAAAATKRPTSVVLMRELGKDDKLYKKFKKLAKSIRK